MSIIYAIESITNPKPAYVTDSLILAKGNHTESIIKSRRNTKKLLNCLKSEYQYYKYNVNGANLYF